LDKKFKILISAYACEPDKGSEPGVGWNWVKQIARFHEVWVITRENNRSSIEKVLVKEPIPNIHWIYFDLPRWAKFWKKKGRGVHFYYYLWQIGIYFLATQLHKQVNFDLIHHITFGNYWMPSFLCILPVLFIWGPVGGGESTPTTLYKSFSLRGKIYELLRITARWIGEKDVFVRMCSKKAVLVIAKTKETAERLSIIGAKNIQIYSEAAISKNELLELNKINIRNVKPFRFVSIARLLHWKGLHLSLMAFNIFHNDYSNSEYWFIGDGPERSNLERLTHKFNLSSKIFFLGNISRKEVLNKIGECDVLLHPSLHDSGGWVCLEAMAAGRPVICLNLGGPALQVTEETGFKIIASSPEQVIKDLADVMLRLVQNQQLYTTMAKNGQQRVAECFNWNKKGEYINTIYQSIIKTK